jgi:hypothetical protein
VIRVLVLVAALAGVLGGCESSQEKSAKLAKRGKQAFTAKGLEIERANGRIKVEQTAVLKDANGAAAVVVVTNKSSTGMANVPLAIDVRGKGNKTLFKNDAPGLEPSLVGVAALQARQTVAWVNDQVTVPAAPKAVRAVVGAARSPLRGPTPKIEVTAPRLELDPVSGIEASGKVTNSSKVEQRNLVLFCVAWRGRRIVAAGRGQIQRLMAGKTAKYHIFFIGNPKGARLSVQAPPTVLG